MTLSAVRSSTYSPQDQAEELTQLCKALADGLRLEILRLLRISSFGVLEICRILDIRQSALSHHLKILATAGLATTRREGNTIFYRRPLLSSDDPHYGFKRSAFEAIDGIPLAETLLERLNLVQQERSEQSLQFFTRHADKFREKQGLVAEHSQYMSSLSDLLHSLKLPGHQRMMEVGPGQGELLAGLASQFKQVIALVNAAEMLNQARATVAEIDELNILQASLLAMHRAVRALQPQPVYVLVDGNRLPRWDYASEPVVKGDDRVAAIAAASILAKVQRDAELLELDRQYPGYGFARHKGYPTPAHLAALRELGATAVHRRSFAPVRAILQAE